MTDMTQSTPADSAGFQEQDATASIRKRFRQTLERFRFGLAIADGLCDRDRRVALFMLEFSNQEIFLQTGTLACWVGVETMTRALNIDRSCVQRAQRELRKAGVITVHEAGGGRGLATTYLFSTAWLAGYRNKPAVTEKTLAVFCAESAFDHRGLAPTPNARPGLN